MAEILPLIAWRYNNKLNYNIEELTSPLFDVVSHRQREGLYRNPYNSIHLSVPRGDKPAEEAAALLTEWKDKSILKQDPLPGIYVYYQYYRLPGSSKEFCRKGFICNIKAYDWSEGVLLRHENTIPDAVNDRLKLLEETQLNSSPTHGLYADSEFLLEPYMDESMKSPLYESENYQGVRDVLSVIHDHKVIKLFVQTLQSKQIILADGHHRYEGSLQYRKKMRQLNPNHTGFESYNYHLIYLTNSEHNDLRVLPTHRVLQKLNIPDEDFIKEIQKFFIIKYVVDACDLQEIILGKKWAFGLYLSRKAYELRLKPEVHQQINWNFPQEVKDLDLTVMHYFIFEKILSIYRSEQRNYRGLSYVRNFTSCIRLVDEGEAKLALITNEISVEQVKRVSQSGAVMPQKSTYFYPKVICGFLFSSIKEDEFITATAACL